MKIFQPPRNKLFTHNLIERIILQQTTENDKRVYITPENQRYPSVTTVIGEMQDKSFLNKWIKKVGVDQANKIKTSAANRGTNLHMLCEHYLLNHEKYYAGAMPSTIFLFKQLQPFLDNKINELYGIEIFLYSKLLKSAGKCDCFCNYNGENTVVDFKTSTQIKKEEWIENYFIQATAYSLMIEELYNISVPKICILIAVENDKPQEFIKNKDDFKEKTYALFNSYYAKK